MSLGFRKPLIIEKSFAEFYGWDNSNAIIYETGNVLEAIQRAMDMEEDKYRSICESIDNRAIILYN